jgi:hypothetical protein
MSVSCLEYSRRRGFAAVSYRQVRKVKSPHLIPIRFDLPQKLIPRQG